MVKMCCKFYVLEIVVRKWFQSFINVTVTVFVVYYYVYRACFLLWKIKRLWWSVVQILLFLLDLSLVSRWSWWNFVCVFHVSRMWFLANKWNDWMFYGFYFLFLFRIFLFAYIGFMKYELGFMFWEWLEKLSIFWEVYEPCWFSWFIWCNVKWVLVNLQELRFT